MKIVPLLSMREFALEVGADPHTVVDLVTFRAIPTSPMPGRSRAKGLDPAAVAELRKVLCPPPRRRGTR